MLHDGHVVLITMKENKIKLFNKPRILNDSMKYENGFNYFWANKVVMTHRSNADVTLVD
jgi:hypothetical protein